VQRRPPSIGRGREEGGGSGGGSEGGSLCTKGKAGWRPRGWLSAAVHHHGFPLRKSNLLKIDTAADTKLGAIV